MKHIMCAVRDRQLDAFMRPFAAQTRGQAIRSFADEVNRAGSELNKHPQDYELFELASFHDDSGLFTTSKPQSLAIASNLLVKE